MEHGVTAIVWCIKYISCSSLIWINERRVVGLCLRFCGWIMLPIIVQATATGMEEREDGKWWEGNSPSPKAEIAMGQRVTGHGSSGSTNLSGSRGSVLVTRWPMISWQDSKNSRLTAQLEPQRQFNSVVSLWSILLQWWCLTLRALPLSGPD